MLLESGKTVEADYVFISTGNKPNSKLVEKADAGAVEMGKYVAVDNYLRVRTSASHSNCLHPIRQAILIE